MLFWLSFRWIRFRVLESDLVRRRVMLFRLRSNQFTSDGMSAGTPDSPTDSHRTFRAVDGVLPVGHPRQKPSVAASMREHEQEAGQKRPSSLLTKVLTKHQHHKITINFSIRSIVSMHTSRQHRYHLIQGFVWRHLLTQFHFYAILETSI